MSQFIEIFGSYLIYATSKVEGLLLIALFSGLIRTHDMWPKKNFVITGAGEVHA